MGAISQQSSNFKRKKTHHEHSLHNVNNTLTNLWLSLFNPHYYKIMVNKSFTKHPKCCRGHGSSGRLPNCLYVVACRFIRTSLESVCCTLGGTWGVDNPVKDGGVGRAIWLFSGLPRWGYSLNLGFFESLWLGGCAKGKPLITWYSYGKTPGCLNHPRTALGRGTLRLRLRLRPVELSSKEFICKTCDIIFNEKT